MSGMCSCVCDVCTCGWCVHMCMPMYCGMYVCVLVFVHVYGVCVYVYMRDRHVLCGMSALCVHMYVLCVHAQVCVVLSVWRVCICVYVHVCECAVCTCVV